MGKQLEDSTDSVKSLQERIESLELQVEKYNEKESGKAVIFSRLGGYISSLFCRQNLELFLSVSALVISVATALYLLK
jgi:chaperonin cofactor prefoldin